MNATAHTGTRAVEALRLFTDAVEQIPTGAWDQPSNLADWTVQDLVGHATGSATKIVTLVEDGKLWSGPSRPEDWTYEDPAARLHELAARLAHALPGTDLDAVRTSPEGEAPLHRALAFPVADLALHSWDVHRSLHRSFELPETLLTFCRELVESVPEERLRRPGGFGPAQPAPDDCTPTVGLMAFLGRPVDTL